MEDQLFSKEEFARYNRHIIIPEFGLEGQQKLKAAKVLVIGSGGLGSPMLLYLAAAGVGTIGIVDFDVVEDSNLQRQVLFGTESIGKPKVQEAKKRLLSLNPYIKVITHELALSADNALAIFKDYDLVADGTDNFPTRYLVNDACVLTGIPNVFASIFRFEGQVSVFNFPLENGERGPNYRDVFPEPPPPGLVPNCAEAGVLGVLPGIIGSLQANEVIKVITGIGSPLAGKLYIFDALSFQSRILKIKRNSNRAPIEKLIDYDAFCGAKSKNDSIPEITVQAFDQLRKQGDDFQLIDVRELMEYEHVNLGGTLIPLGSLLQKVDQIERDKQVIVLCKSGIRSAKAIEVLNEKFGFTNLYNLKGGIIAFAKEIDATLPTY